MEKRIEADSLTEDDAVALGIGLMIFKAAKGGLAGGPVGAAVGLGWGFLAWISGIATGGFVEGATGSRSMGKVASVIATGSVGDFVGASGAEGLEDGSPGDRGGPVKSNS